MSLHEHRGRGPTRASVAVLTVSDTRTPETDRSGAEIRRLLEEGGQAVFGHAIVPDEPDEVRRRILAWLDAPGCDAVIVSGGTGISDRDRTFEAVSGLLDRRLDGFGELFRSLSYDEIGSAAMLSRAVAGIARGRPVFALPGSVGAVTLAMKKLILPELGHLLGELARR